MSHLKIRLLVVWLFVSAVLIFLDWRLVLNPVKSMVGVGTAPVKYAFYNVKLGIGDFFSFLTFWRSGEARIKNLEQRNLELVAFESKAAILEQENKALRSQLGVKSAMEKKLVAATVLGTGQYLELGVGKNEGIKAGVSVFYLDNLVGKVVRLTDSSSFVQLPTDSAAVIPVRVGRVNGLVFGQFNSKILLDRVAQNEEMRVDGLVTTSGEGGSYESGLIVGKIKRIVSAPTDLFQKAEVAPLIDYNRLTTVFVVSGPVSSPP